MYFKKLNKLKHRLLYCGFVQDRIFFQTRVRILLDVTLKRWRRIKALITPREVILEWIFSSIRLAHLISHNRKFHNPLGILKRLLFYFF